MNKQKAKDPNQISVVKDIDGKELGRSKSRIIMKLALRSISVGLEHEPLYQNQR